MPQQRQYSRPFQCFSGRLCFKIRLNRNRWPLPYSALISLATSFTNGDRCTSVSRNLNPLQTALVSITQIHTGSAHNVIPEASQIFGTICTFEDETRAMILDVAEHDFRLRTVVTNRRTMKLSMAAVTFSCQPMPGKNPRQRLIGRDYFLTIFQ